MRALVAPVSGSVGRTIAAPPEAVWDLVADVTAIGRFSPECRRSTWTRGDARLRPGATFRGHNRWGPVRWATTCEVTVADAPRQLSFEARHWVGAATRWTYRLEPAGTATRVTESYATVRTSAVVLALDHLLRRPRRLDAGMTTTLDRLAEAAERDEGSTR